MTFLTTHMSIGIHAHASHICTDRRYNELTEFFLKIEKNAKGKITT